MNWPIMMIATSTGSTRANPAFDIKDAPRRDKFRSCGAVVQSPREETLFSRDLPRVTRMLPASGLGGLRGGKGGKYQRAMRVQRVIDGRVSRRSGSCWRSGARRPRTSDQSRRAELADGHGDVATEFTAPYVAPEVAGAKMLATPSCGAN
jgi:hypothetical protein